MNEVLEELEYCWTLIKWYWYREKYILNEEQKKWALWKLELRIEINDTINELNKAYEGCRNRYLDRLHDIDRKEREAGIKQQQAIVDRGWDWRWPDDR